MNLGPSETWLSYRAIDIVNVKIDKPQTLDQYWSTLVTYITVHLDNPKIAPLRIRVGKLKGGFISALQNALSA